MITDLAHTAFRVHDIEKSLAFYANLGIHEAFRFQRDDGSLMLIYLHVGGDRFLELFPGGPKPPAELSLDMQTNSFYHLCLATDDIHAEVEKLQAFGAQIFREIKRGRDGNLQAWTYDPDGNPIELMQLSPESPQWKIARGEKTGSS